MNDKTLPKIGFVGLGLMGHGMAKNLLANSYDLAVIAHKNRKPVEDMVILGADEVKSYKELAEYADIIIICVTDSDAMTEIIFATNNLYESAKEGTIIVDTGTSRPNETFKIHRALARKKIEFVDAPLSRSPAKAETGELVTLTSCPKNVFKKLKPVFEAYSEIVLHVGEEVGLAHKLKLINNFISSAYIQSWSEGYNACMAANIDVKHLHAVVSAAGMNCLNFQNYSKFVLENTQDGHKFAVKNLRKDINYFHELASELGATTFIADPILQSLNLAVERGYGDDYATVMPKVIGEINNKPAGKLPRGKDKKAK